jgi:succinoglycan biosynthesis transport protein ExoP
MDSVNPQAPPLSFAGGFGIKFYRYRKLVRRHWWILFLTVSCGVAYEGYVLYSSPQLYESKSDLFIREELVTDQGKNFVDQTGQMLQTAAEQFRNSAVLEGAKDQLALSAPGLQGNAVISSATVPRTNILTVSAAGTNPDYTQKYLAAVVESFLRIRDDVRRRILTDMGGDLGDSIKETQKDLDEAKKKLQTFIQVNNMAYWKEQGAGAASYLSGLKDQQANLKNQLQRLQNLTPEQLLVSQLAHGSAHQGDEGSASTAGRPDGSFNSELYNQFTQTTQQLVQKESELEHWKTIWKPKHPKLQKIEAQVEDLKRLLATIKEQNVEATKSQTAAMIAELKSLDSSIAVWDAKLLESSRKDGEYQTLQSDVTRAQSQLEKLLGNLKEIGNGKNTGTEALVVMRRASPATPVPVGALKHMLLGLVGGLIVGTGILLLLDRADDRLASSTEMLEHFSEPILGQIPNAAESRGETGLPLLQSEDDRYSYAEAFRSLRSSLIFMPNQVGLKSILITSAIPNEGKSTIASNLAITMAAAGARVLLVDADLRRGDLAQLFDADGHIGLSDILRGEVNWKEAVQQTKYATLSLISCGPVTNHSGELLLKPNVPALLEEFTQAYDLVIFNTAPILAADDTPTLAPNFDGTLMVVRAQFTSARLSVTALNALYQRQVNVLGLILNCVDTEMPDYYYYRYPKYYAV